MLFNSYRILLGPIRNKNILKRFNMSSTPIRPVLNKEVDDFKKRKPNPAFEVLPTPVKSGRDKKEYKVIKLPNGLVACLIADKDPVNVGPNTFSDGETDSDETDSSESDESPDPENCEASETQSNETNECNNKEKMAAAALAVGVGSCSDPKAIPGLAHFLEHMVFMGSTKYPKQNSFDSFITKNGGYGNASTGFECTVFQFECCERYLKKSLDIFSNFFISPLMLKTAMAKEREAVHSEFQEVISDDDFKKEQFMCHIANPDTPTNSFSWGNIITLRDNVEDEKLYADVHAFRKRHYSAHRMSLAIQARFPMSDLETLVIDCFSAVPSNGLPPDDLKVFGNVYDNDRFNKIYYLQPSGDISRLCLSWSLPSLLDKYKTKPARYVAFLISDEGKGSLLSHLKKKVWGLSTMVSSEEYGVANNSMYTLFTLTINLTIEGLAHVMEVISAVFSYINMLRKFGPQEHIFKEIQNIVKFSFDHAPEEDAVDYVECVSEAMQFMNPEDILTGSDLYFHYDPQDIKLVLDHLIPEKVNIVIMSNKEKVNYSEVEPWFNTLYSSKGIPLEWINTWKNIEPAPDMGLPPPNQYLTTDFSILPESKDHPEYPEKILESPLVELWYRKDQIYKLPRAYYYFYLITPHSIESPLSYCKMEIMVELLHIQSAESLYPAGVANIFYKVNLKEFGIVFQISGYNQKIPIVIDTLIQELKNAEANISPKMFNAVRQSLKEDYYNNFLKPEYLIRDLRMSLLVDKYFTSMEKHAVISQITYEDMKNFYRDFLQSLYIKVLVQGNTTREEAISVTKKFVETLAYSSIEKELYPKFKIWTMPQGEKCCRVQSFDQNNSTCVVTNYYQSVPLNLKSKCIMEIIMLIIKEPLFNILRTEEQLGYNVSNSMRETFGVLGYTIKVVCQAAKCTTTHVDERIEAFVKKMNKTLKNMSDKKFTAVKKTLITQKRREDVDLYEETVRNWSEIVEEDYMFDRLKQEISIIETIKIADIRKFWAHLNIFGDEPTFKKISFQVVGFERNPSTIAEVEVSNSTEDPSKDIEANNKLKFLIPDEECYLRGNFISDISEFKKSMQYKAYK